MPISEKAVGNFPPFTGRSGMVGNFPHNMEFMDVERVQQLEAKFEAPMQTLAVLNEWMTNVAAVKETMAGWSQ
ncbi:hypothetical protein M9H77_07734 [Catharanthus roseus]|uniref:Uncharacterized protein n=1 Tax=Catharanthus roseus TaxID=4058 RepID=A0ACC0BW29_CATRO|nr:hypothetical protein M9H77_07734 [Catharanthus roseus]